MIAGIIAEYNPFHKGHLYQLNEIRRLFSPDAIVVVMSGCFTQRGEPAIADKYTRAETAIRNGADLVIEMPFVYACSNAGTFASGGVKLMDSLKVIDTLFFGSESDDAALFDKVSSILYAETDEYKKFLKEKLKNGASYPKARNEAISRTLNLDIDSFMSGSNNNLGIEYCISLKQIKSGIKPIPILRKISDHNDTFLSEEITSAISIRQAVYEGAAEKSYKDKLLGFEALKADGYIDKPVTPELLSPYISSNLIFEKNKPDLRDIPLPLLNKIKKLDNSSSRNEMLSNLKTKDITYTAVSRALLNIISGLTTEEFLSIDSAYPYYANILGISSAGAELLNKIDCTSGIKLITKKADSRPDTKGEKLCRDYDIKSTAFYNLLRANAGHKKAMLKSEYQSTIRYAK